MDIALHDRIKKDPNYIFKFWVGLMDGDGSIQVNHWRLKSLQYRMVIKLKYCQENLKMLNLISSQIGGNVKIIGNNKFIIWVVNDRKQIHKIIQIFKSYPPITSRLRAQVAFMLKCFEKNNVEWYLNTRDKKYLINTAPGCGVADAEPHVGILNIDNSYFNEWLSGFIEAEGCFSIRKTSNNHSFSIGQNKDKIILDKIKNHFNVTNQVRIIDDKFWFIEIYKKSALIKIINHCIEYPLLGEKRLSFNKFRDLFK